MDQDFFVSTILEAIASGSAEMEKRRLRS